MNQRQTSKKVVVKKVRTEEPKTNAVKRDECEVASILRENVKRNVGERRPFTLPGNLVKRAGMNRSTYYRFITGETDGDLTLLASLAKGFDVPAWQLLVAGFVCESPPYLAGSSDDVGVGEDESEFVALLKCLDDRGRTFALRTLRNLVELCDRSRLGVVSVGMHDDKIELPEEPNSDESDQIVPTLKSE